MRVLTASTLLILAAAALAGCRPDYPPGSVDDPHYAAPATPDIHYAPPSVQDPNYMPAPMPPGGASGPPVIITQPPR
jgi:hypothetical protein